MASSETRPLGQQMVRGAGLFQVVTALPTMLLLGCLSLEELFYFDHRNFYYFL
jgi:hypothetical protein